MHAQLALYWPKFDPFAWLVACDCAFAKHESRCYVSVPSGTLARKVTVIDRECAKQSTPITTHNRRRHWTITTTGPDKWVLNRQIINKFALLWEAKQQAMSFKIRIFGQIALVDCQWYQA